MKALVVGLGSAGSRHLNNLYALGLRDFLVFRQRGLASPVALLAENVKVVDDFDRALGEGPGLVVVANPSAMHFEFAKKTIQRNIPLYLEKPVTADLEQAYELREMQKTSLVMTGFQFRFHPQLQLLKHWLDHGKIGKLHSAAADSGEWLPGWHPWEDYRTSYAGRRVLGGGVLLTQIHDVDYLQWLFGRVQSVYAMGGKRTGLDIDVEDTALLALQFSSSLPVHLRQDYWRRPAARSLQITGELGQIEWDYIKGSLSLKNFAGDDESHQLPETWTRNDLFLNSMKHFLDCLREGKTPEVTLADGISALEVAMAARRSMAGGGVVQLGDGEAK